MGTNLPFLKIMLFIYDPDKIKDSVNYTLLCNVTHLKLDILKIL